MYKLLQRQGKRPVDDSGEAMGEVAEYGSENGDEDMIDSANMVVDEEVGVNPEDDEGQMMVDSEGEGESQKPNTEEHKAKQTTPCDKKSKATIG